MVSNASSDYYILNRTQYEHLRQYLLRARAGEISNTAWESTINACHGERRSGNRTTFHIGIWRNSSTRRYMSCILGGKSRQIIADSIIDHGTTEPSLAHVLNEHKRRYQVTPNTSSGSSSSDTESDHGPGGSGVWGSGQCGRNARKVHRTNAGTYFYYDSKHQYHECDSVGNDIPGQWSTSYSRASGNSSQSTYTNAYNQGYGATPSHAGAASYHPTTSYYPVSSHSASSAYYTAPTSSTSSQTQYFKDRTSGRTYYVDSQGKTHWAWMVSNRLVDCMLFFKNF